jgi:hypothetical protein
VSAVELTRDADGAIVRRGALAVGDAVRCQHGDGELVEIVEIVRPRAGAGYFARVRRHDGTTYSTSIGLVSKPR